LVAVMVRLPSKGLVSWETCQGEGGEGSGAGATGATLAGCVFCVVSVPLLQEMSANTSAPNNAAGESCFINPSLN
jgi:hypothetical protein